MAWRAATCVCRHVDCAAYILSKGADAFMESSKGENCIHVAAKNGHVACLEHLLGAHVAVPHQPSTCLASILVSEDGGAIRCVMHPVSSPGHDSRGNALRGACPPQQSGEPCRGRPGIFKSALVSWYHFHIACMGCYPACPYPEPGEPSQFLRACRALVQSPKQPAFALLCVLLFIFMLS